jgi:hypothetical protein
MQPGSSKVPSGIAALLSGNRKSSESDTEDDAPKPKSFDRQHIVARAREEAIAAYKQSKKMRTSDGNKEKPSWQFTSSSMQEHRS